MCEGDLPGEAPQKTQITMPEEVLVPFVVIGVDMLVLFLSGEELRGMFWRPRIEGVKGRAGDEPPDAMVAV
jgi:hypothetical protein